MKTTHHTHRLAALLAFAALLAGPPALSRADSAASAAAAEEPVQLDALEVRTDRARDEHYKAERTRLGTKTDTPLLEIPQSLTVITSEQIADQQMLSLSDVVRYVPGVSAHQGENNRDQIIFRGNSSSADFFLNGVRDDVQYYRDIYNLDRVEILRGPNAMIFGRGGAGGVINRVAKEADFSPLHEVTVQAGSFDYRRAALDLNEPLNRLLAFRLNGVAEDSGSFRHGVALRRQGLNPTLTFRPQKRTNFTLGYEYRRDRRTADRGITSFQNHPADVPIETFYGNANDSSVRADVQLVTGAFEHRAANVTVRNRTLFGAYDRFYQNYVPGAVNATQTLVSLSAYNNATQRQNLFNQTDVILTATTGRVRHTLLTGLELGRQRTDNFRNTGYFDNTTTTLSVPFANPATTTPVGWRQSATDADNHLKTDLAALYAQDQVEFTAKLSAIVGLRLDSFDLQYRNRRTGEYLGRRDQLASPRAGLVFKPAARTALYANYSVSFLPSSGDQFSSLTTVTQQVKPESFRNREVGAKFDLSHDFFLTAALYRLDRTNTRATDPNDPTRIVQTGSQRSDGFEFGVNGSVTDRWTVSVGYACQDVAVRSATSAARAGAIVAQTPRHSFSFWNKVEVLSRLQLGLGLVSRSAMFASVDNTVSLPGYTRIDAAVFYTLGERWRAQLNAENLFDRKYFLNADSNTNLSPGAPRTLRFGLTSRF